MQGSAERLLQQTQWLYTVKCVQLGVYSVYQYFRGKVTTQYKFLAKKGLGTHRFCKKCDEATIDGLKMMQTLQDKTRCIEEKVDRLEIGVKKIETVK